MPPADSPVDATDRATERRAWYQRVTTVVTGISPAPANPRAKTAYTSVELPALGRPGRAAASETPPTMAPATIGMRTSRRAMRRATYSPATPPTTKYSVVASEIEATGQPCSSLNAVRYTARP